MKRMHTKYVRQLLPAPSSAQDLPEIRRRGRRLELIVLTTFACTLIHMNDIRNILPYHIVPVKGDIMHARRKIL